MKHSLLLISLALSASTALAQTEPRISPELRIPPVEECFPTQFGGKGVNYTAIKYNKGTVFSWWCQRDGQWQGTVFASVKPLTPITRVNLSAMKVIDGYSRDRGVFMAAEVAAQAAETKPK